MNRWLAERITALVGTMPAAWLFVMLACVSLPAAVMSHDPLIIVSWIAQTFLQLVLLPIIMVGQNISAEATERTIRETHEIVLAEMGSLRELMQKVQEIDNEVDALELSLEKE